MSYTIIISLILLCAGASFVQRVCGFGFGVFLVDVGEVLVRQFDHFGVGGEFEDILEKLFLRHFEFLSATMGAQRKL